MEGDGPVTGYALIGASLGLTVLAGCFLVWFHCRRAYPPIKARFWWQSELICITSLTWTLYRSASIEFPGLGARFYVLSYPLFLNLCFAALIRLSNVYSAYKVAGLYTEWKSSHNTLDINAKIARGGCFIKYGRHIQNPTSQRRMFIIHAVVQAVVWGVIAASIEVFNTRQESVTLMFILVFYALPILYLARKIIPLKDGLYLRQEVILTFCGIVLNMLLSVAMRGIGLDFVYIQMFRALSVPLVLLIIFIVLPLHKSYVWQKETCNVDFMPAHANSFQSSFSKLDFATSKGNSDQGQRQPRPGKLSKWKVEALESVQNRKRGSAGLVKLTLKQVLAYPEGVAAFKEFCSLELNHESILFFLDVKAFCGSSKHSEMSLAETATKAKQLYEKYVKPGAPLEINIGDGLKENYVTAGLGGTGEVELAKVDFKLLDITLKRSRDEIFKLMATDPFVRFLRHRLYRDFVKKVKEESTRVLDV